MPRRERLYFPGLPQLIKLNGHNHEKLFQEENDYARFLTCVDRSLESYNCELHAYSLQADTVLLLLTPKSKEDLSRFIQHIGRQYVPYYNNKYQRTGALWDRRYNSCLIETNSYFLLVSQYVDTFTSDQSEYNDKHNLNYSSYGHNTGECTIPRMTEHQCYLQLGKTPEERGIHYQHFLYTTISQSVIERIQICLNQNCVLGTNQYCQKLEFEVNRTVRPHQSGRPRKHYSNDVADWIWLENRASKLLARYCYQEIRFPVLEYWDDHMKNAAAFADDNHNGPKLNCSHPALLRGEGTMGCLRVIAQHQRLQSKSKLWYIGAMFRNVAGQKQDFEQYHQIGVEAFGYDNIDIELEHILMQYDFFSSLHLTPYIELKINTAGSEEEFSRFRQALREYYQPFLPFFEEPWLVKLKEKPEQLLSTPHKLLDIVNKKAPRLSEFLSEASAARFRQLLESLNRLKIPYSVTPGLYPVNNYCHTLFEWRTTHPDSHDELLCRGGRYDASASHLLDKQVAVSGFAFMLDPIIFLIRKCHKQLLRQNATDVVLIPENTRAAGHALMVGRRLRTLFPHFTIKNDCSGMRISTCRKNAERNGSRFIIVVPSEDDKALELTDKDNGMIQFVNENAMIGVLGHSVNC
ncbi:ATP phosphoribosyltransferase regulatory subunit [Morganella morganii]|uniref:ATP phosphoribosyltransferase regulatory subunit n=1 Tax=Morganella morganii TaxID=582 RepID=UPI00339C1A72